MRNLQLTFIDAADLPLATTNTDLSLQCPCEINPVFLRATYEIENLSSGGGIVNNVESCISYWELNGVKLTETERTDSGDGTLTDYSVVSLEYPYEVYPDSILRLVVSRVGTVPYQMSETISYHIDRDMNTGNGLHLETNNKVQVFVKTNAADCDPCLERVVVYTGTQEEPLVSGTIIDSAMGDIMLQCFFSATATVQNKLCHADTSEASITINADGGNGLFHILLTKGSTTILNGHYNAPKTIVVGDGTYTAKVTNSLGDVINITNIVVQEPTELSGVISFFTLTETTQPFRIAAYTGTSPYRIVIIKDGESYADDVFPSFKDYDLPFGYYTMYFYDANNCSYGGPIMTNRYLGPAFTAPALNLYATSIYLEYKGNDAANWSTIEYLNPSPTQAQLSLNKVLSRLEVTVPGTCKGFRIKNSLNQVVAECPAAEGIGDGYNDILHNIYSNAANNYNNHFKLQNVILSTTWVKDVPRYTDPYLAGYSLESLGTNLVQGSTCEVIPKIAANGDSVNATPSIINGQLNIIPTNTSGVYRAGRNTLSALHAYKLVIDVVSGTNPVQISLTNYVNNVTYPVTTFPQIAYTRYFRPLVAPENLNIRSFVITVRTPTIIDNFYFYRVLNNLLYGVKRPPHALLAGQDASNFTLTNPA